MFKNGNHSERILVCIFTGALFKGLITSTKLATFQV